jgi:HlyD family secretion protein
MWAVFHKDQQVEITPRLMKFMPYPGRSEGMGAMGAMGGAGGFVQPTVSTVSYSLDPFSRPKALDFQSPGWNYGSGIYELQGDRLTLCLHTMMEMGMTGHQEGSARPTKLAADDKAHTYLVVLKRIAKPAGKLGGQSPETSAARPTKFNGGTGPSWMTAMIDHSAHDFGTVARGTKLEHRFIIENKYKEDIHIQSVVSSSADCFQAQIDKQNVKTFEKANISVTVNTQKLVGERIARITVTIDKPFYAQTDLCVSANIGGNGRDGQPNEAALRFGPLIERTVNARSEGKGGDAINLAKGTVVDLPKDFVEWSYKKRGQWCVENDVDLSVDVPAAPKGHELLPHGSKFVSIAGALWDTITQTRLQSALIPAKPPAGYPVKDEDIVEGIEKRGGMLFLAETQATYAFQTRKGQIGIFQVLAWTENPLGMKIRYKLVQPETPPTSLPPPTRALNAAAELRALQGSWKIVRVESGRDADAFWTRIARGYGYANKSPAVPGDVNFKPETMSCASYTRDADGLFSYRINPAAAVKTIDLYTPYSADKEEKRLLALGSYEFDGERLKIHLTEFLPAVESQPHPHGFSVDRDSGDILLVLERHRPAGDEKAMQGDWAVVSEIENGKPMPEEDRRVRRWRFLNDRVSQYEDNASRPAIATDVLAFANWYCLDAEKRPKTIRFAARSHGQPGMPAVAHQCGIYKFEGDRLVIACRDGNKPPENFEAKAGSGVTLSVLEKAKPNNATSDNERKGENAAKLLTASVERGNFTTERTSVSGVLQPGDVRNVSAQVSGQVVEMGDDPRGKSDPNYKGKKIDYGSPVEEGTILAKIDDAVYRARFKEAEAEVARAKAELESARVKAKQHTPGRVPDSVRAAEAVVAKTLASMEWAQTNLDRTVIRSPIKGVVIARRVDVGITVVAAQGTPSPFLIAKDPRHLKLSASVDENVIARIRKGMKARVCVAELNRDVFKGTVTEVLLGAGFNPNGGTMYTIVVDVENPEMKIQPYMNATAHLQESRRNILYVPTAALLWRPRPEQLAAGVRVEVEIGPTNVPGSQGVVWVKAADGKRVRPVEVRIVNQIGQLTEISGSDVKEGMAIVFETPAAMPLK